MIYLDCCASAPIYPQVTREVCRVMDSAWGNPGAIHQAGTGPRKILRQSRRALAELLGFRDREIFFTSGGTESNNWAIKCGMTGMAGQHLVVFAAEHKSVLESAAAMERGGCSVTILRPDRDGLCTPRMLEQAIRPDTALVSIQAANNETGILQDVAGLAAVARKHRVRFHCDGVQSFGHVSQPLNLADYVSVSAHKLGGPVGIGCLAIRSSAMPAPLIHGGGQELGLRSGTENAAGAAGFALAAQLAHEELPSLRPRLEELTSLFEAGIRQSIPGAVIHGAGVSRLPGVSNVFFPDITGEEMVARLDLAGICASPGAACAAQSGGPSHVLLAMGLSPRDAEHSVRFSMGRCTTRQEILETLEALRTITAGGQTSSRGGSLWGQV